MVCTFPRLISRVLAKRYTRAAPQAFGVILLILALFQFLRIRRTSETNRGYELLSVIVHDQGFYYTLYVILQALTACTYILLMFSFALCSFAQAVLCIVRPNSQALNDFLAVAGSPIMLSLFGCRLMIHLKEIGEHTEETRNVTADPPLT